MLRTGGSDPSQQTSAINISPPLVKDESRSPEKITTTSSKTSGTADVFNEIEIQTFMPFQVRFTMTMSVMRECQQLYAEGRHLFCRENKVVLLANMGSVLRDSLSQGGLSPVYSLDAMQSRASFRGDWRRGLTDLKMQTMLKVIVEPTKSDQENRFTAGLQIVPCSEILTVIEVVRSASIIAQVHNLSQQAKLSLQPSSQLRPAETFFSKDVDWFGFLQVNVFPFLSRWIEQISGPDNASEQAREIEPQVQLASTRSDGFNVCIGVSESLAQTRKD